MEERTYLCDENNATYMLNAFLHFLQSKEISSDSSSEGQDEMLLFSYKGLKYVFMYDKNDVNYFRILLPNIVSMKGADKERRAKYLDAVNEANNRYKVAKFCINDDMISMVVEQFSYSLLGISSLFERSLILLDLVGKKFKEDNK